MVCPNLNGYKASFDFYFCPWSNYYGWMDNNNINLVGDIVSAHRWSFAPWSDSFVVRTAADAVDLIESRSVKAGSLLDYLGYSPGYCGKQVFVGVGETRFDPVSLPAEKLLSVIDIYRNYYCNPQEGFSYFVTGYTTEGRYTTTSLKKVSLQDLDTMIKAIRLQDIGSPVDLTITDVLENYSSTEGGTLASVLDEIVKSSMMRLGGLPLRTYRMDLNRGLLKMTEGEFSSRVLVSGNSFSIDTLRFANKLQKLLDRIDVSGGRFADMMRTRWGVTPRNTLNVPDYLGSVSNFFGITDVIATASGMNTELGDRGNSVVGQQTGFAVGKVKRDNSPISFRADQYGTLVCMFSLVPIVTYSQGIEREDMKLTFADIFDPAFNQLGYQDVDSTELCALPQFDLVDPRSSVGSDSGVTTSTTFVDGAVGRRFAWSEYMSSLPRAHGLFAYGQDFDYWVNNRTYQNDLESYNPLPNFENSELLRPYGSANYSTYVDPAFQNNLFADVSRNAQNFRLRVNFDMYMRRNVGSRVMPHL